MSNNLQESQSRSIIFDIAKGLGIIFVAIFHLVYRNENSIADFFIRESIWFLIPFFFAISACFFKPLKRNFWQNIIRRVENLLVPAILYTAFFLVIFGAYWGIFHEYKFSEWLNDFVVTFLRPEFYAYFSDRNTFEAVVFDINSSVWFVWVLAFTDIVFYFLAEKIFTRTKNLKKLFLTCTLLILTSFFLYDYNKYFSWSLLLVPFYAAIMLCSFYLAISGYLEKLLNLKYANFYALICFILHVLMFKFYGNSDAFKSELGTIGNYSLFPCFIQTFVGGYAFLIFCKFLGKIKYIFEFFAFIGRNSLDFLLMHRPLGAMIADLMGTYVKSGSLWYVDTTPEIIMKSIFVFSTSILICFACSLMINSLNIIINNRKKENV